MVRLFFGLGNFNSVREKISEFWQQCWLFNLYDVVHCTLTFVACQNCKQANTTTVFDLQPKVKKVKKVAPAPYTTSKPVPKKVVNPLIEKRPRNFGIGKNKSYLINLLFLLNALLGHKTAGKRKYRDYHCIDRSVDF